MKLKALLMAMLICVSIYSSSAQQTETGAFGIFIDNSGSLRTQLEIEVRLGKEILNQIVGGSLVSIFGFATDPASSQNWATFAVGAQCNADHSFLTAQIDKIYTVPGQTTLLDAISDASERLATCEKASNRSLVLITDGEDRASKTKPTELLSTLKRNRTRVLVVGLINELLSSGGFTGKFPRLRSKKFLEKLAKETGGKAVFRKKNERVEDIVRKLLNAQTPK